MGEQQLKFIVNEVNKLLNTDYNMISFDSLPKTKIFQIYIDCLHSMKSFPKMDVERNLDDALTKLVKYFSDIQVPMPPGVAVNDFAEGIIQGKRNILHMTLYWILSNQEEVKKRSYLSKYLIKVELNPFIVNEPDMEPLLVQYEELIQEFKKLYAQTTRYSKVAKATVDLRNEIDKQTKDLSNIMELIVKQKAKMDNIPNKETLLVSVKALRSEVVAEKQLLEQIKKQSALISQLETNLRNTNDELKDQRNLRQASGGPLNRLQEEVQTNRMIVQERLPHELEGLQNQMQMVENIAVGSEPSESEISTFQEKVDQATQDFQFFIEKTMLKKDPRDEKLLQFRQHAAVVANNKQLATEQYMELKEEFGLVYRQIQEKEAELQTIIGGNLPQGEDLRQFVSHLRDQSVIYKERRAQLLELQAEVGVLVRTQDILHQEEPTLAEVLQNDENDTVRDEDISQDISEMKQWYKELISKTDVIKTDISQIRKELHTEKENTEDLNKKLQEQKQEYDSALTSYNRIVLKLQQEINKLEENVSKEEIKWKDLRRTIDEKEMLMDSLYKDSLHSSNENKNKQVDALNQNIKREEDRHVELEEEIKKVEKDKEDREEQVNLWHSTLRVLQCKRATSY